MTFSILSTILFIVLIDNGKLFLVYKDDSENAGSLNLLFIFSSHYPP